MSWRQVDLSAQQLLRVHREGLARDDGARALGAVESQHAVEVVDLVGLWYRSRMRSLLFLLSLGTGTAAALLPVPGRADIPPPDSSPDAHCTLEEQCKSGTLCPYAFNPSSSDGAEAKVGADCRAEASGKGLERRCKDGGNYGGQDLFCPVGETGTWSPGRSRATRSGSCSLHGDPPAGALLLLGLCGLWARRRR